MHDILPGIDPRSGNLWRLSRILPSVIGGVAPEVISQDFSYLDLTMLEVFEPAAIVASVCPTELKPTHAIAIIPMKRIAPKMAFASSHLSNVRLSSGDSF